MGLNWWQIVVWVLGLSFGMMGLVLRRGFWVWVLGCWVVGLWFENRWRLAVWLAGISCGGCGIELWIWWIEVWVWWFDGLRFGSVGFGWFCAFCGLGQWLIVIWINGSWLIFKVFWFVVILGDGWSLIVGLVVCCESCDVWWCYGGGLVGLVWVFGVVSGIFYVNGGESWWFFFFFFFFKWRWWMWVCAGGGCQCCCGSDCWWLLLRQWWLCCCWWWWW